MLSADERMFCQVPSGYQYRLLLISYLKYELVTCEMTAGDRLELLEGISGMVDDYLTKELVAMIDPACETAAKMFAEATALDRDSAGCEASFNLLTSFEVFGHFVRLNPSLLEAIRSRHAGEVKSTARQAQKQALAGDGAGNISA
jgi:hypothetical protein